MLCSVLGFNQEKALQYDLDMTDLLLLSYIMQANGNPTMKHTVNEEISYVWLSHDKLKEDLPILKMAESTLKNRLVELKKKDLITSVVVANNDSRGSMAYYSVTEKTIDLTTTSRQKYVVSENDTSEQRPRTFKSTSNNTDNTYTDKLSKDNLSYKFGGASAEDSVIKDKQYSKEDFLGSAKRRKKSVSKPSLYSQCMDQISSFSATVHLRVPIGVSVDENVVYTSLVEYLNLRLSMKDKPIYGSNQWKGMLIRLGELVDSGEDAVQVIKQSIEHGWASFYPVNKNNQKKDVFSEYGQVTCEKSDGKESSGVEF